MGKKSLVLMGLLSLTLGWFFPLIPIIFFVMLMYHIYNNYIAPSNAGYYHPAPNAVPGFGGIGGLGGLGSSLLGGLFGGGNRVNSGYGGGGMMHDSAPPPYPGFQSAYGTKSGYQAPPPASSSGGNFMTGMLSGAAAGYMLGGRRQQPQQPAPQPIYVNPNANLDTGEPTHTSTSYAATKRR